MKQLEKHGEILISNEGGIPTEFSQYGKTFDVNEIHSYMLNSHLIVGESATMASEAACLGIPSIFISYTGRCYTTEQDKKYGLIKHFQPNQFDKIQSQINNWASKDLKEDWNRKKNILLKDKIDVTHWVVNYIQDSSKNRPSKRYGLLRKKIFIND